MKLLTKTLIVAALAFSTVAFADSLAPVDASVDSGQGGTGEDDSSQTFFGKLGPPFNDPLSVYSINAAGVVTRSTPWSIFEPFLLDMPGGGKGIPVHDANDATKIIGYMKMPERPKPTGPVHCMIKETGLLAKSVDACEAAGGAVAK